MLGVFERRACRVLGQHPSTQRHVPRGREDEERLVADMTELARLYGRYGYRRVAVLLRDAGWSVSDGRVERLRAEYVNHVSSYDFVHHRTDYGRAFRTLCQHRSKTAPCAGAKVRQLAGSDRSKTAPLHWL